MSAPPPDFERPDSLVFGNASLNITPQELTSMLERAAVRAERRESSHFATGEYVKAYAGETRLTFERVSQKQYLIRGESPDHKDLEALCLAVSQGLSREGVVHSLEVYDGDEKLLSTFPASSEA